MNTKRFPLGKLWTNCYVIWDENKKAAVIDPGGEASDVIKFLSENNLKLQIILLTHGHYDHIGGLAGLIKLSENGVAIHEKDSLMLTDETQNLSCYVGEDGNIFNKADKILKDGEFLDVGDMRIKVMHTPGHTQGSVTFLVSWANAECLYSGDTLFARSVGRTDLPGGDEARLFSSIKKLAVFPDAMKVYPGHGPSTTIGDERAHNPYWP